MCVTTHGGPVTFQPSSTSLGLKRDYLGALVLLFMLRITVRWRSCQCFQQLSAILAGQKNYSVTLFARRALALFVFWSGLPLASNGLPSTHKSHSYAPLLISSSPCFVKRTTSLFAPSYFLSQRAAAQCRPLFFLSCSWKRHFLQALRATNVNHRKAIMRVKLLPYCYQSTL